MFILKAKDLRKEWNGAALFDQVAFDIKEGERLVLFGRNGTGKTTLLQGLLGRIPFDGGVLERTVPLEEWGWLDQQLEVEHSLTLLELVQSGSAELYQLKRTLEQLQNRMNSAEGNPGFGDGGLEAVMAQYDEAYGHYVQLDGYDWEVKVEKSLQQMKLGPALWNMPFKQLSGGQKTKAQLAALSVRDPAFIVLDEPTNHLDAETLDWLEHWVAGYPGTVLYVSHDRAFIDRTATAVLELSSGGCRRYTGGYSDYRKQQELELRSQEALYKKQELEREKLLESIRRYSEWFQQSHKAAGQNDFYRSKAKKNVSRLHAKESALERLDQGGVRKPREASQLHMQLEGEAFAAATLLRMEGIRYAYEGGRELFQHFDLSVNRGDRLAVLGPNGAGKSTLMKLMTGRLTPSEGAVQLHPQTKIGYFAQELDNLRMEETILDCLLKLPGMTQSQARTILGCFLFPKEAAFKRIGQLSMGEQCRVAFLMLLFSGANLLVLDEPTNYLDIDTRERVEEALQAYAGALIIVTHDRYFIRKVANRLMVLDGEGAPRLFSGTYDEYAAKDRSRLLTPEEQGQDNERAQLELRLAQLMGAEEPEAEGGQGALIREIRQLRKQIADLQE